MAYVKCQGGGGQGHHPRVVEERERGVVLRAPDLEEARSSCGRVRLAWGPVSLGPGRSLGIIILTSVSAE